MEMPKEPPAMGPAAPPTMPQPTGPHFERLIGASPPMLDVYQKILQAAASDVSVLLLGETGTGKDLAAQAIHARSARRNGPYVPVNLGALPAELVPSELFGHERGAFTGATSRHPGKFEQANGGDIFLDEIDAADPDVQVTLLRLIEQQEFQRVGGTQFNLTDARVIVASSQNLEQAVAQQRFRPDLYYRLDVFRIELPPLRERHGDIPLLAREFLEFYNHFFRKNIAAMSTQCMHALEAHLWPGNVRELKNVIQRAVLVCNTNVVGVDHLPARFLVQETNQRKVCFEVGLRLEQIEREMVLQTLNACKNNRKQAAAVLGISRHALYNKLAKHGIK